MFCPSRGFSLCEFGRNTDIYNVFDVRHQIQVILDMKICHRRVRELGTSRLIINGEKGVKKCRLLTNWIENIN